MEVVVHRSYSSVLRLFKDCKMGWWTSIILTVVFTSVYICVYKVAVRIILIYSTRGALDSAEDIYSSNNNNNNNIPFMKDDAKFVVCCSRDFVFKG